KMRHVTGMDHERRLCRQCGDFVERLLQGGGGVGIDRLVEPEVTVADLGKGETAVRRGGLCLIDQPRARNAARDGPYGGGSCPRHALQKAAAIGRGFEHQEDSACGSDRRTRLPALSRLRLLYSGAPKIATRGRMRLAADACVGIECAEPRSDLL